MFDRPSPIVIGYDTWIIMRTSRTKPVALVRLLHRGDARLEHYRLVTFELDPRERVLIGRYRTLEAADDAVRYPVTRPGGIPRGREAFGLYGHDVDLRGVRPPHS